MRSGGQRRAAWAPAWVAAGLLALALVGGAAGCDGAGAGAADGADVADDPGGDPGGADVAGGDPAPALVAETGALSFSDVAVGQDGTQTVVLLNPTTAAVLLARVALEGDAGFSVAVSGETLAAGPAPGNDLLLVPPLAVAPGANVSLLVAFARSAPGAAAATLRLYAEGRAEPVGVVALGAPALDPPATVTVTPAAADFGVVALGTRKELELRVAVSGAPVTVESIGFDPPSSPAFALGADTPATPLTVAADGALALTVGYTPVACADPGAAEIATLVLVLADGLEPLVVPLTGTCEGPNEGWVVVDEGPLVVPQTRLHLSLAGTSAWRFEWRVEQPAGSQGVFVPSPTFPAPTFEANVAGTYRFSVVVRGEDGAALPPPASYEVRVVPEAALHVELLWTTPGDDDETDQGPTAGADLDLHVVHPDAPADASAPDHDEDGAPDPWFDPALDCFWFNPHPDWGTLGLPDDDPRLDRDDTDGAGPENFNLYEPEEGAVYRVAVHAWNDHGFGASFATVRVYFAGELAWEAADVELASQDLWCVAGVDPIARTVTPCEAAGEPYRITPGYQPPGFGVE
jgi:hypothetical protein